MPNDAQRMIAFCRRDEAAVFQALYRIARRRQGVMLWTLVFSYPLMAAMQEVSARIGRVTGGGIAANLRKKYPKWLLYSVVALMVAANMFNLGADIGAMGAAA